MTARVGFVFGTRPEIIKLAPVITALGDQAMLVHTGQHFDDNMSRSFLDQLRVGRPEHHLAIGGLTRGAQIGQATEAVERLLLQLRPAAVVVQGDTNSGLAGALAANAASVPVVHLEAGLRSFDRTMPEEHNRVLIDAVSELCLVPHPHNAKLLKDEGVAESRIRLTGSTLRDALEMVLPSHRERQATLGRFGLTSDRFVLATIHRVENADDESNLRTILEALAAIDLPVVLPLHPRTRARAASFGLDDLVAAVTAVEPLGYREFIALAACSALIVSDSGGVQEEACILGRPVIVVRTSTERPELLGTFAHLVPPGTAIAETAHGLLADIERTHAALAELPYPYGDDATARCVRAIGELSE